MLDRDFFVLQHPTLHQARIETKLRPLRRVDILHQIVSARVAAVVLGKNLARVSWVGNVKTHFPEDPVARKRPEFMLKPPPADRIELEVWKYVVNQKRLVDRSEYGNYILGRIRALRLLGPILLHRFVVAGISDLAHSSR